MELGVGVFAALPHREDLVIAKFFQVEVIERGGAQGIVVVGVDRAERRAVDVVAADKRIGFHTAGGIGDVEIRVGGDLGIEAERGADRGLFLVADVEEQIFANGLLDAEEEALDVAGVGGVRAVAD